LREWAYTGVTFLTIAAVWSHLPDNKSPVDGSYAGPERRWVDQKN